MGRRALFGKDNDGSLGDTRVAKASLLAERGGRGGTPNRQLGARGRSRPSMRDRIITAMADTLVEDATHYLIEEEAGQRMRSKATVQALVDASHIHGDAREAARALAESFERLNGMPIDDLYMVAAGKEGDFGSSRETPEDFGHYMVMEALGHGVAWDDSAPSFPHRVPSFEFHAYIGDDFLVHSATSGPDERFAHDRQRGVRRRPASNKRSR